MISRIDFQKIQNLIKSSLNFGFFESILIKHASNDTYMKKSYFELGIKPLLGKKFQILNKTSPTEVLLGKGLLKISSKVTIEHSYQSAISMKLLSNFIEIAFRHGCPPVNLLHIFGTPIPKNTSEGLFLSKPWEPWSLNQDTMCGRKPWKKMSICTNLLIRQLLQALVSCSTHMWSGLKAGDYVVQIFAERQFLMCFLPFSPHVSSSFALVFLGISFVFPGVSPCFLL